MNDGRTLNTAFSPEFSLLVQCCQSAFAGARSAGKPIVKTLDWQLFVRLAQFHRVQGLVWSALCKRLPDLPPEVAQTLRAEAVSIATANMRAIAESGNLLDAFYRAGLPLLFVKGLTLGVLAYANPTIKAAVDIDLLIEPDSIAEAARLMGQCGYDPTIPKGGFDSRHIETWHALHKESVWRQTDSGSQIDLHTRLADHPRLIPTIGIASPRQVVAVSEGISLPTLAEDPLFAYLCVHGASSAWFRLKWITDLAALLHRTPPAQVERLYRRSQELGAGRAAAQALLVAEAIYGTLHGLAELKHELEQDRANRWLRDIALRQMAGRAEAVEPTETLGGTAPIHYSQLLLLPGVAFKLSEFARQVRSVLGR